GDDNNVAGNDLVVGNNHTSGTGHSIGQPQDGLSQATVNVYNCTGKQFTLTNIGENPSTNGEWLSPAATPPQVSLRIQPRLTAINVSTTE
ncbi:hypothetical protein, partial [Streptomyces osmaniensis]|uniref:hypothetical protein n=1 Tax=Streptomyces osmaniensis TaxID=593134 RepID=UPI0031FC3820